VVRERLNKWKDWKWSRKYYGDNSYPIALLDSNLMPGMLSADNIKPGKRNQWIIKATGGKDFRVFPRLYI